MEMAWACKVVFSSLLLITIVQASPFRVEDINQKWNVMESNIVEESRRIESEQEIVSPDKQKRFDNYYPQQPEYRQDRFFNNPAQYDITDIKLTRVPDGDNWLKKALEKTFDEQNIISNVINWPIKAALRSFAWFTLDMVLYGPRTIFGSIIG